MTNSFGSTLAALYLHRYVDEANITKAILMNTPIREKEYLHLIRRLRKLKTEGTEITLAFGNTDSSRDRIVNCIP